MLPCYKFSIFLHFCQKSESVNMRPLLPSSLTPLVLYYTNMLIVGLFYIMLGHWNNSPRVDMSLHLVYIIVIQSQPVFALSPECDVLSGEATNTIFIVFGLISTGARTHDLPQSMRARIKLQHRYNLTYTCMMHPRKIEGNKNPDDMQTFDMWRKDYT